LLVAGGENIGYLLPCQSFNFAISIDKSHIELLSSQPPDGCLTCPHETRQNKIVFFMTHRSRYPNCQRRLSIGKSFRRLCRRAANRGRISSRLSPPSFSRKASAMVRATTASPTTAARGTAQKSERS